MIIFSFQPLIDFIVENLMLRLYRFYYKTYVYISDKQSKQSQMNVSNDFLKFLDLHAGPEYCFYAKAANTSMVVIICLFFGPGMPILYFIGLLTLGIQYFMERLTLTYFYRIPPKFSPKMTLQNIRIMQLCPIIRLLWTFWLYTN